MRRNAQKTRRFLERKLGKELYTGAGAFYILNVMRNDSL